MEESSSIADKSFIFPRYRHKVDYSDAPRKCAQCKQDIYKGDVRFGSAALYEHKDGHYGSMFWRHPKCAVYKMVKGMFESEASLLKIEGFADLKPNDQQQIREIIIDISSSTSPKKRRPGSGRPGGARVPKDKKPRKKDSKARNRPASPSPPLVEDDYDEDEDSDIKQKKKKSKKDPNAPKKPKSAYFMWLDSIRPVLKDQHPELKMTDIAKLAGNKWKNEVTEKERKKYKIIGKINSDIYQKSKKEYEMTGTFQEPHYKSMDFEITESDIQTKENDEKDDDEDATDVEDGDGAGYEEEE